MPKGEYSKASISLSDGYRPTETPIPLLIVWNLKVRKMLKDCRRDNPMLVSNVLSCLHVPWPVKFGNERIYIQSNDYIVRFGVQNIKKMHPYRIPAR